MNKLWTFHWSFFQDCQNIYEQSWLFSRIQETQLAITCSKLTIETLEQGVKYV